MAKKVFFITSALILLGGFAASLDAQTSLLSEDFSGTFPPAGWYTSTIIGQNQWFRNDYWGRPNYTPGGNDFCADNDDDGAGPGAARVGNNVLASKPFSAAYYDSVWLAYDVDWYPVGTQLQGKVDAFNGSSWVTVMTQPGTRKTTRDSINITSVVANTSNARVRFLYTETSGGVKSNWYEVDDVDVWGSCYDPPDSLDLAITRIIRPESYEKAGTPFLPTCVVYNNLDTTAHALVTCKITDIKLNEQVYSDSKENHPLNPGNTTVEFDPFTPAENAYYNAVFTVDHPDDVNPGNDTANRPFTTVAYDVTPYHMERPEKPTQFGPFCPTADYAERKNKFTEDVKMYCWIQELSSEEWVYRDSLPCRDFEPYDTCHAVFDTACLDHNVTYVIRYWANDKYNVNISNPPLVDTFNFTAVEEMPAPPCFEFKSASPGICSQQTTLSFTLNSTVSIKLNAYDVTGKLVETLARETRGPGSYRLEWNTADLSSGIYFVRMQAGDQTFTTKVLVIH